MSSRAPFTDDQGPAISDDLVEQYLELRQADIVESKLFYFERLMPEIAAWLEARPQTAELRNRRPEVLVSLMGFSPETTALVATILRPAHLVIAYSDGETVKESAKPALEYLQGGIVDHFGLTLAPLDPFDPRSIHEAISSKLPRDSVEAQHDSRSMMIDITGGTKVMSATAGALAWERNLSYCYLKAMWDPRRGAASLVKATELQIHSNPSRTRGYDFRAQALESYERGSFVSAADKFGSSLRLLDDFALDLLGRDLCECYAAMADFDRDRVNDKVARARVTLEIGGVRRLFEEHFDIDHHLDVLAKFAAEDNLTTKTAAFLEFAELYSRQDRHDFAGLLRYRAMEGLVEIALCSRAPGFEMDRPDWALLGVEREAFEQRFSELFPRRESTKPPDRLGMLGGFVALAALDDDLGRRFRSTDNRSAAGMISTLGKTRNRSYLAHGFDNLGPCESESLRDGAQDLARAVLGDQHHAFLTLRQDLRPLNLRTLWPEANREVESTR